MATHVYHNGRLIPVKDWDYATSRPKVKQVKKKEPVVAEVELLPEVQPDTAE